MPSRNDDGARALAYHERTRHSPRSVRESGHSLDWDNKPAPFKIYPDLPAVALPRDFTAATTDTFGALSSAPTPPAALDLDRLAGLLFLSAGVTKTKTYPGGGRIFFRAAPSTGALYQTEVYVVAGDVSGLPAGVYHFGPGDFALRRLRAGDFRRAIARAAADETMATAGAIVVLSAIYWRNTWKYEARGYRHLFWDAGTMLSHVFAAAEALRVPARLVAGFVDAEVNALLGLDATAEGALAIVSVGQGTHAAPLSPPAPRLDAAVIPLSAREVTYPLLVEAYADSCLDTESAVRDWRARAAALRPRPNEVRALKSLPSPPSAAGRSLGETIQARGSTREFSGEAIAVEDLSSALFLASRKIDADLPSGLVDVYLTVHAVDGLAPGSYAYHPEPHALELLAAGDVRATSAFLCLGQPLGGASSATVFFLADLEHLVGALGNRGYRAANLAAGIAGGRLYLSAYARRFGATGLTFYDASVVDFFSPHAAGKDAVFVTALGRAVAGPVSAPVLQRIARR